MDGYMPAIAVPDGRGCVAQLVEQLTLNQRVHSSILCTPTKFFPTIVPPGSTEPLPVQDCVPAVALPRGSRW